MIIQKEYNSIIKDIKKLMILKEYNCIQKVNLKINWVSVENKQKNKYYNNNNSKRI